MRDKAFYKVYTFRKECVDVYGILGFHVEMDDVLRRLGHEKLNLSPLPPNRTE